MCIITQLAHDCRTTLLQRRFKVLTSFQRPYNVVLTFVYQLGVTVYKLFLSPIILGGWNHEKELRYSKMVQTAATRKICIDSILTHLSTHKFDGVDVDWEYPGNRGSPAGDKELYTTFLHELKDALKQANVSYSLSASVGAGRPVMAKAYEIEKIKQILDWVNLMSYDLHGSWENVTGHSTAMTGVIPTVPDSVNAWLEGGMPPSQIALGIATYGRTFTLANTSQTGLGAPDYGPGLAGRYTRAQGFLSYYEVCLENWTSVTTWEASKAGAPYASKGNQWVGYETQESVQHKVKQLVNGHNLRGIAVWALDLDDFKGKFCGLGNYPIITAAVAAMNGGYENNNNEVIRFHSHNEKKKAAKRCYANPKWRQFQKSLQTWCETECVVKSKPCPPWLCMCF